MLKLIRPLVMMQLKDKIDLSYLKSKKTAIQKIVLSILAFALVTAVIFLLLFLSKLLHLFHLADIIPISVMVVVFTIMEILALISCTFGLMKNLYFSKDNPVLLTLPVTTNQVFLSKIIVYFIYELKKTLYFIVPLFLAYGLISGLPIYFILWLVVCWFFLSLFNVAFASLFSIATMGITMFLRNFHIFRILLFLIAVGGGLWIIISLINLIPEDLDIVATWGRLFWDIQDFLNGFVKAVPIFAYLTQLFVGGYKGLKPVLFFKNTLIILAILLGVVVVLFALAFLISRPLFFKMAAKPFEYRKVTREFKKKNRKINSFLSAVKAQALLIFRTSDELFSLAGCAVAMPILILLLNRIFAAMSTKLLGDYMTVAFNLLIILLISLATNGKIASVYSREGAAAYLNKTRPNEYRTNLLAKLIPNAVVMTISIIVSTSIFAGFTSLTPKNVVLFGLTAVFVYLLHLLWSAEMDIMNPQYTQYATTGECNNNPNETKSTVTMFIMSVLFVGVTLLLSLENIKVAWLKVVLVALALFVYRIWSYLSKIKYYYKEK